MPSVLRLRPSAFDWLTGLRENFPRSAVPPSPAACILAARKLVQWDGRPSPALESYIVDAITMGEDQAQD